MARRPSRKQLSEYLLAGGLALLIVWLVWLVWGIAQKEEIARHAVAETKAELASLESRKTSLTSNIQELDTSRGEEATLRSTYGVAKPGEDVIIVVPVKNATSTPPLPWWRKALNWLHL